MAVVSPVPVPGPVPAESILTEPDASLLFSGARTAYTFTDEPVTDAQLRAIHELAKWAPTAVNAQPPRVAAARSEGARGRREGTGRRGAGHEHLGLQPHRWLGLELCLDVRPHEALR